MRQFQPRKYAKFNIKPVKGTQLCGKCLQLRAQVVNEAQRQLRPESYFLNFFNRRLWEEVSPNFVLIKNTYCCLLILISGSPYSLDFDSVGYTLHATHLMPDILFLIVSEFSEIFSSESYIRKSAHCSFWFNRGKY